MLNFSFTGYLTDEEVEHNYLNATALLYLSSMRLGLQL
jgi:hypothetical protein